MSVTSETEALKTNEFLRRRKLRIQQVREQSKDIAKKIRQRAKVEKLKQIDDIDSKKQKEYFKCQEKLVRRLENLYAQGVKSVGESHKNASEERENQLIPENSDISKLRGKDAVAELRKTRQQKLDEQKKLLDRKLLAREAANVISREKSSRVSKKVLAKPSSSKITEEVDQVSEGTNARSCPSIPDPAVAKNDMATQWDFEELPNEWGPVPALSLPKDDKDSLKDSQNAGESKSEKSKRLDLFALSEEMPSSLRGGSTALPENRPLIRPSLTLVSEYLQSRALRLRETDTTGPSKKQSEDLQNLKQTIIRSRSSKIEVKGNAPKSTISSSTDTNLQKKHSVTMYNHLTRDCRDIPHGDSRLVVRDLQSEEDAYSQALKETNTDSFKEQEHQKKLQEMRNKVAMTKQTVEKEYNDTVSFLKSLPKEKCSKHVQLAHMDERRQKILKVNRQHKLQQEFKRIEKESRKNNESIRLHQKSSQNVHKKTRSPDRGYYGDDIEPRDMQYSWMPVPESDGNLAIHTIPNTVKEVKSGNSVKFSDVDSYHEYRSRHKHTPPTKDTCQGKRTEKQVVETVLIENNEDTTECSSLSSDTSSVENLNLNAKDKNDPNHIMSDADRIIIYKILNSKVAKKEKERKKLKLIGNVAKVLKSMETEKTRKEVNVDNNNKQKEQREDKDNRIELDQIKEGVYKVVNEKGDNMTSLHLSDNSRNQEGRKTVTAEDESKHKQPCCCNKESHKKENTVIDANLQSGNRNISEIRNTSSIFKCGNNAKNRDDTNEPSMQPSAATSTSSFKTATIDKTHDALPDGGLVKLINDVGQEAGKFYIGASGFLKDDAYEVIIQLRKKELAKIENDNAKHKILEKSNPNDHVDSTVTVNADKQMSSTITDEQNKTDKEDDPPPAEDAPESRTKRTFQSLSTVLNNVAMDKENTQVSACSTSSSPHAQTSKKLVDKSAYTSSQLSYAIPSDAPKTDPIRPATSTATQTTFNSPNQRPVFMHMSSSTSTAYMSPPEKIIPKCLRDKYQLQGKVFEKSKRCKHERCAKKQSKCRNVISSGSCRKSNSTLGDFTTPPNTARYNDEITDASDIVNEWNIRKNTSSRSHKCGSQTSTNNVKSSHKVIKSNVPIKKPSCRNLVTKVNSRTASYRNINYNIGVTKKMNKPGDINPIVKKYVNTLLNLKREGLKAIEVANQDCSSVSTPGSSIIKVPRNLNKNEADVDNKTSLEQMKNILKPKILEKCVKESTNNSSINMSFKKKHKTNVTKMPKKRSVHKVKSLNISKRVLKTNNIKYPKNNTHYLQANHSTSSPSPITDTNDIKAGLINRTKPRSKSSPAPRQTKCQSTNKKSTSDTTNNINFNRLNVINDRNCKQNVETRPVNHSRKSASKSKNTSNLPVPDNRTTTTSSDSEGNILKQTNLDEDVMNMSTQTSQGLDSEINLMKIAEDKLHNMEKIADLTEKCTKRLSNLAKVLEEVRKNKSLAYSQISTSDTASDTDQRSEKNTSACDVVKPSLSPEPVCDVHNKSRPSPSPVQSSSPRLETPLLNNNQGASGDQSMTSDYIPFLTNIPKPTEFKYAAENFIEPSTPKSYEPQNLENNAGKRRDKPPPALSRIHLKNAQNVIPHELSTVVEVDSPMSVKLKNKSSLSNITKPEMMDVSYENNKHNFTESNFKKLPIDLERQVNPDILQSNKSVSKRGHKVSSTDLSEDSKMQMMDLKQFNALMLKPFISIQEFVKQCGDVGKFDEGSNLEDVPKADFINDELSSLHSDGSLPDVISELLKRKIITEPFKFDTVSNVNSTTVTSESTLSVLALSKVRKEKKKSSVAFNNKENMSETSDSLSISSNPDLENAFKKLGMGWASSTLKKTKERLALSSSSNTSSSSLSHFKLKKLNNQDIPVVTDSMSSKLTSKKHMDKSANSAKNVEQQTSFMNSMTVKEFLTNELANKITFTNKSNRNDTEEEFVSLFETKMPDEMKHMSQSVRDERSVDSLPSGQNNRARTSTPVQLFKSMTYHSSSSSNMSNCLFSNADDLSSVKVTSNSIRNHSTSDKDDLTIPNCSLKMRKGASDSKSE